MRASKVLLVGIVLGCGQADPAPSPPPLPAQMASNGATAAAGASPPAAAPAESEVAAPAEIAPADALRIDAAAQGAIDRNEIPGAVVVVVAGDRVVYQRAYGLRAKEPAAVKIRWRHCSSRARFPAAGAPISAARAATR